MKFRTEYKSAPESIRLSAHRNLIFFGSCFSENICRQLRESLWPAYNVAGVLYNPVSIVNALTALLQMNSGEVSDTIIEDSSGIFHSLLFDSDFSSLSREEVSEKIRIASEFLRSRMEEGADIVITFGTSWVYRLIDSEKLNGSSPYIVGNCHKLPASAFERELLKVCKIAALWKEFVSLIKDKFPSTKMIFTISPVRHLKDGFAGNSLSKSILRVAIEEIQQDFPEDVTYFPSFEILNDDLRDYRFYASDLVHPSEEGIEYILEKFTESFISAEDRPLLQKGRELYKGFRHRAIIPGTEREREYITAINKKWEDLRMLWPQALDPRTL